MVTTTELLTVPDDARRRARRSNRSPLEPGKSVGMTLVMSLLLIYSLFPLVWLFINATKTQQDFMTTPGLAFGSSFALFDNIAETFAFNDGEFMRWMINTLFYVVMGSGGATIIATLAGYGLAHFSFPGRRLAVAIVIGAIAIPGTALAVPIFILFSQWGLTNNPWGVVIASLLNPFGLFLIWAFASSAIPRELIEAGRIDGAGELRIFFQIAFRLIVPGFITVLLFNVVSGWNNYFMPLILLNRSDLFPLPVGLAVWNAQNANAAEQSVYHLVITGAFITLVPIIILFLFMQRYWQSGLSAGSVKV